MTRGIIGLEFDNRNMDRVVRLLRALVGLTLSQEGCGGCWSSRNLVNGRRMYFISEWKTNEDLDRYVRSDIFKTLLSLMELSIVPPEVKFESVSEIRGMEYVSEVRNAVRVT